MRKARFRHLPPLDWGARTIPQACNPSSLRLLPFQLRIVVCHVVRLGELFVPPNWTMSLVLTAAPFIGVATFFQMRVYRMVTRFGGMQGVTLIVVAVTLSALYWGLLVYFSGIYIIPRSVVILYPVLAMVLIGLSRQAAGVLLRAAGVVGGPTDIPDRDRTVVIYSLTEASHDRSGTNAKGARGGSAFLAHLPCECPSGSLTVHQNL